jgi:hypothetical protein
MEEPGSEVTASKKARPPRRGGVIGRSGAVVGLMLVVVGSAFAFALTSSTAAHTTLPSHIEVGSGIATQPTSPVATTTTSTPLSSTTSTSTPHSATATTSTIPKRSTTSPSSNEQTTVVKPVPTVRVEDDHGSPIDDEGAEGASGKSDDQTSGDH